jgi:hypothetical protein
VNYGNLRDFIGETEENHDKPRSGQPTSNYRSADKSLARPTSRCILFDGENISLMLVLLYIRV